MGILTRGKQWWPLGSVVLISVITGIIYILWSTFISKESLSITFLDVGQGDSIFIDSPTRTQILIDGGPGKTVSGLSSHMSLVDRDIDLVIPTHADHDHIAGLIDVFKRYKVTRTGALHSDTNTETKTTFDIHQEGIVLPLAAGDTIDIGGGALLTILHPYHTQAFSPEETNESSTVVLLSFEGYTFLLTGDISTTEEMRLIETGLLPKNITVLKAGHHGSNTSTGETLLSYTAPSYVVVSAGANNRYGHPHEEVLGRISRSGAYLLNTQDHGDITFTIRRGDISLTTEKE